jgi:hypothetical protein
MMMQFPLILLSTLLLFSMNPASQTPTKRNAKPAKKVLSLDQVLGCTSDEWFTTAWPATQGEMKRQDYAAVALKKLSNQQPEVGQFPFVTSPGKSAPNSLYLYPANRDDKTDEKNFCHSNIVVSYLDDDYRSKPIAIEIYVDEGNWTFDFSQVLRRADQFKWKSGVFSDSADAYLSVVRGDCTLQFVVSTGVPQLYRVIYEK